MPATRCFLIWKKQIPENFSMAMCEYAWTSFDKPAKMFRQHVASNGETKIHPCQKSVALYAWILKYYANDGETIFDPMTGSGSSRIAAYKMGFDYVGCELDKDYFDAQEKRYASECLGETKMSNGEIVKQLNLF
jgi:site-specific DNA-methyltransferase (adenine-specific)